MGGRDRPISDSHWDDIAAAKRPLAPGRTTGREPLPAREEALEGKLPVAQEDAPAVVAQTEAVAQPTPHTLRIAGKALRYTLDHLADLVVKPVGDDQFLHVIMPMHLG